MRKSFYLVAHTLSWVLLCLLLIAALMTVGARLIGFTPYVVLSGSMEPAFPTGSLIYVQKVDPAQVKVGDPVTFVLNQDLLVATHRVVEIDPREERFITKGDANQARDGQPVHFNNLLGIPRLCLPKAGYLFHALSTSPGKYWALSLISLALLAMVLFDFFNSKEKSPSAAKRKRKFPLPALSGKFRGPDESHDINKDPKNEKGEAQL